MNATGHERPPASSSERTVPVRFVLITAAVGLVLGLVAFGVGRLMGHGSLTAEVEERDESLVERDKELSEVRDTLSRTQHRVTLLEAHTAIYRAIAELDRRNFGLANESLERAAKSLSKIEAHRLGLDKGELAKLQETLEGQRLEVDADLAQQREGLFDIVGQLDRMVEDSAPD